MVTTVHLAPEVVQHPRGVRERIEGSDRAFRWVARSSGAAVLVIMTLVGVFLAIRAAKALSIAGTGFLTEQRFRVETHHFGIAAVLVGTLLIAAVALTLALPMALGISLYITEYAPPRLRRIVLTLVDLMAAVPSVVYGLWGVFFLQGHVIGVSRWLSRYLGWFPPFKVDGTDPSDPLATSTVYTSSTFIAGMVVALMITPITASVIREVFTQAPSGEREAAYALGATRWGMIRSVVLPFARGGIIGGAMLGLGRAMGETIAVFMIISPVFTIQPHILQNGANSVSALIALRYGEATPLATSALMAAGLTLFLLTLVVNFGASSIVARSRSGAESG